MIYQMTEFVGTKVKRAALSLRAKLVMPDAQLIELVRSGNHDAFGELLKRHQDFVYRAAWGYLRDSDWARDVCQEVFLKAYSGLPYFRNECSFPGWLYKICKNQCLNLLRKHKLEVEAEIVIPAATSTNEPLRLGLQKLIDELPPDYREAIILRYYDDLKYNQIAEILGVDIGLVKIRLHRARQILKDLAGDIKDEVL